MALRSLMYRHYTLWAWILYVLKPLFPICFAVYWRKFIAKFIFVKSWILLQVKNFILIGDVHESIYFLTWKEQGAQLSLLAKDFGSLNCFATEFLIDASTLSLVVSDDQKNVQVSVFFFTSSCAIPSSRFLSIPLLDPAEKFNNLLLNLVFN